MLEDIPRCADMAGRDVYTVGLCLVAASASIIKLLANSYAAASANTELRLVYSA